MSVEEVRHENGSQRLVAWTNTPRVGEGGVITGLVRVGVEIRDEDLPAADPGDVIQLDEEKVGELQDEWMDSFPLMCWRTNSRGKIKFFNRQWLDFRGRSALEECDNGWMDGLHEEDYDSLVHAFDTSAKTGARVNHVARMIGGDGQYRWLRFVSARDFSDLEGASDGFIGYCEDLGRTIRLESELSAARSRYDELLEDSTSAFRSKRSLEERIRELEGEMEQEIGRLSAERESAVSGVAEQLAEAERSKEAVLARATEQLAQVESEREGELAKLAAELEQAGAERGKAFAELDEEKARLEGDHSEALAQLEQRKDMQLAEALEEKGEELARLLEEKRLEFGRALEAKEANLKKSHEETQGEFAKREEFLKAELEETVDELARLRESSKRELKELANAHAEQGVQHAQGIASLKSDFEGAAAEREQLAIEVAAEKERQAERESELAKLRDEIDAVHQDRDAAVAERDRTEILPENAPFGMVLIARDGAILYSNPATDKIAGVDFNEFDKVEEWLMSQAPSGDEEEQERLLKLWRDGIWRHDGTKVVSMQTDEGLRELELRSKLLPDGQVLLTIVDMTDSLRAEEALRASEVKFRSIFYDSGVGMALVDKTGNIFDANPAQEKLLGYSRAELRKMHIEDCLSLEEISRTQELAKEMAEKRSRSGEMTISLQPKDRRPAWAHMNVSLVRDPDGEVIFAAYFFHDITKEREAISKEQQATSSLATSQAEKQALIETSPDLIIVAGPDGIVERVVPPVSFPLHVDHSMEGHSVAEVVPPIADDFPALAEAARASGGVETKAFSILQGDETFHFECRIARSGDLDSVIVIRDVTAAKLAEEVMRRQALTFANIRDAIIVSDLKGRIKDWNPAAEEMFGYSREEAIGKGLYALYDPEEPKRFKQTITAAISKHRNWEAHTEFRRKDGSGGMCEVRYTPLLDESGRPLALVGVSRIAEPMVASAPAPVTTSSEPVDSLDGLRRSLGSFADIVAVQEAAADLSDGARGELASNRARLEAVSILLQTIEDGGDLEQVDFGQYVRKLIQFLLAEFGPEHTGIEVHLNVKGIMIPVAVAQPLAIILFELMSNSLRHAFARRDQGMVGVSMGVGPDSGWLVVNDDGRGLPSGFDFDSPEHGAGLRIAASQAKRIGGEMTLVNPVDTEIQVGFRLNGAT